MLQEGGLGAQINQKADAYRSNPDALQKKAKLSGDLMDALALQKVMSDKAMAKQQLALSQQQDAGSVVEQMEQKLVGMNKEELTAQTAGIMGERNKQKQKQISAAAPPQKPPMQMAQGAPQGLPAAPRPPMQMAQGGIIGYKKGDKVSAVEAKGSRLEQALKAMGILYEDYMAMRPEQKKGLEAQIQKEYIKQRKEFEVPELPISGMLDRAMQPTPERVASDAAAKANYDEKQARGLSTITDPKTGQGFNAAPEEYIKRMKDTEVDPSVIVKNPLTAQPVGDPTVGDPTVGDPTVGDPNVAGQPPALDVDQQLQEIINTPATDYTTISKKQATDAMGSKFNTQLDKRMAVDPEAKKQAVTETLSGPSQTPVLDAEGKPVIGPDGKPVMKATGGYDRQGKAEGLAKYLKQKEDLDKELLDPSKVKKAKYNKWMEAVQGGGLKAGRGALNKFDTDRAASRQSSITEQKAMYMEDMKFDTEIADKIGTQAIKVFEIYADDVSKAMDTAATVGIANLDMFYKEAKMAYDSNQDGIKNKIDAIKTSTASDLNKLIQSQASFQDISNAANSLYDKMGKLEIEFFAPFQPEILGIETELRKKGLDPARRKQLLDQRAEYDSRWEAHKSFIDGDKLMQIYKQLLEESASNKGFSSQLTTIIENINKTSTGTSQQQTTGLANARQQAILKKQATTKYVPTD